MIRIDKSARAPFCQQIVEQVKQLIAIEEAKPGDHLPTVRQLAHSLNVNPGTVARAYLELEQGGIVVSRRGGGTVVSARADDPLLLMARQTRLSNMVSGNIVEALSLGYNLEELEAAFNLHLARWRQERQKKAPSSKKESKKSGSPNIISIVGSHDLILDLLINQLKLKSPKTTIRVTNAGSLGGLIALQEERADLAGIHLRDEETGEYNCPFIKRILPGRQVAIVHLAYRIQGLMLIRGNPKQIKGLDDLIRSDITFVNRQQGSGTRVLLDLELRQHGILPSRIKGYQRELDTHLAAATSIARGEADVGLGIEVAAHTCSLDFIPLFRERYDLVMPMQKYRSQLFKLLLEIIASEKFRAVATNIRGYDTSQTGATSFIN